MNQNILSIDISAEPAQAAIVSIAGKRVEILETYTLELKDELLSLQNGDQELVEDQDKRPSLPTLQDFLDRLETPWRNGVLVISPEQSTALNLELPFNDPKQVKKILPLEVQDLVPFDIDEFHLSSRCLNTLNGSGYDVHVDMLPRDFFKQTLEAFQNSGFDPRVVSFPSHALSSVYAIAPDYFQKNSAIIWASENVFAICSMIDGKLCTARTLQSNQFADITDESALRKALLLDFKLTIGHIERRYEHTIDKIYVFSNVFQKEEMQQALAREVEMLHSKELIVLRDDSNQLAPLAAVQAAVHNENLLANFRAGDFKFRPQFREVISGIKALAPYLIALSLVFLVSVGAQYFLNESKINELQTSMAELVQKSLPGVRVAKGQELPAINDEIEKLESQLLALGSLSALSPLEALLEISKDLPKDIGLSIEDLNIRENKLILKGSVPDYSTLDKIEQALKKRSNSYCSVKIQEETRNSRGTSVGFSVTLQLC